MRAWQQQTQQDTRNSPSEGPTPAGGSLLPGHTHLHGDGIVSCEALAGFICNQGLAILLGNCNVRHDVLLKVAVNLQQGTRRDRGVVSEAPVVATASANVVEGTMQPAAQVMLALNVG